MTPTVLYLGPAEGYDAVVRACAGRAETRHVPLDTHSLASELRTAEALIDASMAVPITDEVLAAAPRLRVISCATTGSDHIERQELSGRGIPVRTLREDGDLLATLTPAAELSWALVLACARRLVPATEHVLSGGWGREAFPGKMLRGRRLGLIGCGRLGQWMARYGEAFGMEVVGHDPHISPWPESIDPVVLEDLIATSDVVSVHVHLSDETRGLVSRSLLEKIKPGAIFVNTSRGAVADETALLDALASGRLGAAGLDVLEGEPDIADHPLVRYAREHRNVVITPHIGGFSPDALRLVCRRAAEKALSHLEVTT